MKVLDALPTNEDFSLQQFIFSWNHTAPTNGLGRPMLGQYEDILLCDTIIGAMKPYLKRLQPPVLTQYLAKFFCELCHVQYSNIDDGSHRFFQCVPLLPLPVTNRAVSPGQLLTNFLNSSFEAICPVASCQNRCRGATYEAIKGRFTLFKSNSIVNGWSCSIIILLLKIISDSKTLSQKNFRPIFLRGTPAQFFFWKKGQMANT